MEKINVVELLKDYPQCMELDCTMYEDVYFDYVDELNIIHCYIQHETYKTSITFNQHGTPNSDIKSKCVIFPKGKTSWDGFVPPCKFKDGDVISNSLGTCIFKGEGRIKGTVDYYCGIVAFGMFRVKDEKSNPNAHYGNIADYRLATEEEKQNLFDAIKDNGYKWDPDTKILLTVPKFKVGDKIKPKGLDRYQIIKNIEFDRYILNNNQFLKFKDEHHYELVPNKFDINKLNPFDRVLVRLDNCNQWYATLFSHVDERMESFCRRYVTVSGKSYTQMIPYEGNEHLCGTKDDCDEYFKNWLV